MGGEPTGVFFYEQTAEALAAAVEFFEASRHAFDPKVLRDHAFAFGRPRFKEAMARHLGVPPGRGENATC